MLRNSRFIRWWMFLPFLLPVVWFAWIHLGDALHYSVVPSPEGYDESLKLAPWFEPAYFIVHGVLGFLHLPSFLAISMLNELGIHVYTASRLSLLPVFLLSPALYSGALWLFHWNWLKGRQQLGEAPPAAPAQSQSV